MGGRVLARALLGIMALGGGLAACDALLGIGDYHDRVADAATEGTAPMLGAM